MGNSFTQADADNLRKLARGETIDVPNLMAWLLSLANSIEQAVQGRKVADG